MELKRIDTNLYKNTFTEEFDKNGNPIFSNDLCVIDGTNTFVTYLGNNKALTLCHKEFSITPDKLIDIDKGYDENNVKDMYLDSIIYVICYFYIGTNNLMAIARASRNWNEIYEYYKMGLSNTVTSEINVIEDFLEQRMFKVNMWNNVNE